MSRQGVDPEGSSQPDLLSRAPEDYATRIAREWNTKDEPKSSIGYVLRLDVDDDFLARYEVHGAGGRGQPPRPIR